MDDNTQLEALLGIPGVQIVDPAALTDDREPKEEEVIPTEVEGPPIREDECMYCRTTLKPEMFSRLTCDPCHYERLTVAERIAMVEDTANRWGPLAQGDYSLVQARVHITLALACTLAQSRDERLVRQWTDGLLAGFRASNKLVDRYPFNVENYRKYAESAEVWGD